MTKSEIAYFNTAKAVSELSNHPKQKLGAVVVYKHRIISFGSNSITKCDPIQSKLDSIKYGVECPGKCHAETSALIPLIKNNVDCRGASIYVSRCHKDGTLAMARPCSSCEKLIRSLGIKKVYYTVNDGYAQERWT